MRSLTQKNLFVALAGLLMTIFLANCSHCGTKEATAAGSTEAKASCCVTKNSASTEGHEHKGEDHHHHHGKDHKH